MCLDFVPRVSYGFHTRVLSYVAHKLDRFVHYCLVVAWNCAHIHCIHKTIENRSLTNIGRAYPFYLFFSYCLTA